MLHALADAQQTELKQADDFDDIELLEEIGMLQQELSSMRDDVRQFSLRRAELSHEANALHTRASRSQPETTSAQFADELGRLTLRYQAATDADAPAMKPDFFKKMFFFMMSELT